MSGIIPSPSPPSASPSPHPAAAVKTTTAAPASNTKDNASRLRENQRRSRARKKEYLASLEARFQACQRIGIEANVEIQNAAKRVVRENLLLREMLRSRGVGDDEIDRVVRDGGEGAGSGGESAVDGVIKVLGRRPCAGGEPINMEKVIDQERFIDRRNSTGMLAARHSGGRSRGYETSCSPDSGGCDSSAMCSSQQLPLSPPSPIIPLHRGPPPANPPAPFSPQHYPSPGGTPTSAALPAFSVPASPSQIPPYYPFSSPPSHFSPPTTTSTTCATYPPYYTATTSPPPPPPPCCYPSNQPQSQQQQQQQQQQHQQEQQQHQQQYPTPTTPCHLAQTFIQQLRPQNASQLVNEICPQNEMAAGCHVDSSVLFGLLDKI